MQYDKILHQKPKFINRIMRLILIEGNYLSSAALKIDAHRFSLLAALHEMNQHARSVSRT
jgi:hypothetical protein